MARVHISRWRDTTTLVAAMVILNRHPKPAVVRASLVCCQWLSYSLSWFWLLHGCAPAVSPYQVQVYSSREQHLNPFLSFAFHPGNSSHHRSFIASNFRFLCCTSWVATVRLGEDDCLQRLVAVVISSWPAGCQERQPVCGLRQTVLRRTEHRAKRGSVMLDSFRFRICSCVT